MPLIVWRWSIFQLQIVGIDWTIGEWNLIVVRVVECFGERVRSAKLIAIARNAFRATQQETVVFRLDAGFQIRNRVRTAHDRIEHSADCSTNDEMRAEVVQIVGAKNVVAAKLALDANIRLLDHRILHGVVDDVDSCRSGAGQNKSGEGIRECRRSRWKLAIDRIEQELRRNEKHRYLPALQSATRAHPDRVPAIESRA